MFRAMFPEWSERTIARFAEAAKWLHLVSESDEQAREALALVKRRNGTLNVSKFLRIAHSRLVAFVEASAEADKLSGSCPDTSGDPLDGPDGHTPPLKGVSVRCPVSGAEDERERAAMKDEEGMSHQTRPLIPDSPPVFFAASSEAE